MPNWCDTTYICDGSKRQLTQLYNNIRDCREGKYNLIKNDFGNLWLGNLLIALGCKDPNNKRARGDIVDCWWVNDTLVIHMETAWCEQEDVRKYIEIKYPKIKVYYQDIEEGCEYYFSNDVNHKYFSEYAFIQSDDGSYVVYSETELKKKMKELKNPEYHLFKYEED